MDDGVMTDSGANTDAAATDRWQVRTWKVLALIFGAIVVLETAVLLGEPAPVPEPAMAVVSVPRFVGRSLEDARIIADAIGLEIEPTGHVSDEPISTVLGQRPNPGVDVARGSVVSIVVATAAVQVVVPDLLGVPEREALRLLSEAGLVPGARAETPAPQIDLGAIAFQDPPAGARVPRGTPVTYSISVGQISPSEEASIRPTPHVDSSVPPLMTGRVGDYWCMVLPEASAHIRDDGFEVGRISYSIEGGPVDDTWAVVQQDPAPRSTLAKGGSIDILLASPFGTCSRTSRSSDSDLGTQP
jgi:beta-lactam-binding protein with PASTA domain